MQSLKRLSGFQKNLIQGAICIALLASCMRGDGAETATSMRQDDIVAGYGEKTFTEKYHLDITLPMPEAEFLVILDRLKLHYEVYGERGTDSKMPLPRHATEKDLSKAIKCYEIYGQVDHDEGYRAFVDGRHQVIYIESAFSYTGP